MTCKNQKTKKRPELLRRKFTADDFTSAVRAKLLCRENILFFFFNLIYLQHDS